MLIVLPKSITTPNSRGKNGFLAMDMFEADAVGWARDEERAGVLESG